MKISYNREKDIMLLEVSSRRKIDYAEEAGPIIIHFSKDRHPVLLEILDASEFLAAITKASVTQEKENLVEI
jgi:uncharacterized protein YuzE